MPKATTPRGKSTRRRKVIDLEPSGPHHPQAAESAPLAAEDLLASTAPSERNTRRSAEAIQTFQRAQAARDTPPVDFCSRILQPLEVQRLTDAAEALLDPGPVTSGAGEAVPSLGLSEPPESSRHVIVDTLERPTTVSVRASEHRLQLLDALGLLQSGIDTAQTARAQNAVEKMLCHQLAGAHAAAMNLLGFIPGLQGRAGARDPLPAVEIARLGNTAARLMDAFAAGCQALTKMKSGGTQRVLVQHQQLVVAQAGPHVVINEHQATRRRRQGAGPGSWRTKGGRAPK